MPLVATHWLVTDISLRARASRSPPPAGATGCPSSRSHRWNRNPRPQPKKFSKPASLITNSWYYMSLNWLSGVLLGVGGSDFIGWGVHAARVRPLLRDRPGARGVPARTSAEDSRTALQPLTWCSASFYFNPFSFPKDCFFHRHRHHVVTSSSLGSPRQLAEDTLLPVPCGSCPVPTHLGIRDSGVIASDILRIPLR